ncbi:CDP-diacylglycerol--serine O-phosphatidyltransferase [Sphingobacterium suaedae]|uniref:CDP-diacylglycerol--serine O-phosphatidyltransferase n=1 Tax=Sphingobacterium suaedae TaxID=1686402 RepID=A0ABW5KIC1_9SPHI
MKKHIPNTLTCLNLFFGCLAVLFSLENQYDKVFYCVLFSGIFDFFDGMLARALDVKSIIGKELDSLADMVSFGFVPGTIFYMLLQETTTSIYIPYFGFLLTIFSAIRLAKFNVDKRQTSDFIGLNTPMTTFFVVSLPFITTSGAPWITQLSVLLPLIALLSYLLVSEIRFFSMKLSSLGWKPNRFKYVFLLISAALIVLLKFTALPFILVGYIFFSWLHFRAEKRLKNKIDTQ